MKRLTLLALIFFCIFALVGCSKTDSSKQSNQNYAEILVASRPSADKTPVITNPKQDTFGLLELYDLAEDTMQQYAISFSAMNNKAYGIAIVMPEEGKTDLVVEKLNAMIESCQNAFRNYLPDEYEIAQDAKLEIVDSGEVVLAMCKDDDVVLKNIVTALQQKESL